jgi:chromosome condensin MukBEF MukE localization factor
MGKILLAIVTTTLTTFFSCVNSEIVDINDSGITLRVGETTLIKSNQDTLSVKLISVTPLFSEGQTINGVFSMNRIYDAKISIDDEEMVFRIGTLTTNGERKPKSWEYLETSTHGTKTYKSHKVGISDIYFEGEPSSNTIFIVKILIK